MERKLLQTQNAWRQSSGRAILPNGIFTDFAGHAATKLGRGLKTGIRKIGEGLTAPVEIGDINAIAGNPSRHGILIKRDKITAISIGDYFAGSVDCGSIGGASANDEGEQSTNHQSHSFSLRPASPIHSTYERNWQLRELACLGIIFFALGFAIAARCL